MNSLVTSYELMLWNCIYLENDTTRDIKYRIGLNYKNNIHRVEESLVDLNYIRPLRHDGLRNKTNIRTKQKVSIARYREKAFG